MSATRVLVDNDIVFKLCAYARHRALIDGTLSSPASMLPVGRFVLRDLARKSRKVSNRANVEAAVEEVIAGLEVVSPDNAVIALAAEFEEMANARALELDPGESQLLAVLLLQGAKLLLTGDKRAITAIEALGQEGIQGRIGSLEQVLLALFEREDIDELRSAVCSEPFIDVAGTACFACHSVRVQDADIRAGLHSYIGTLKKIAPNVMCEQLYLDEM